MNFADKLITAALLGLLSLPVPAMAAITAQDWGVTADDGRPAKLFTLTNANGMEARISSYGGVVVSLTAPDRNGKFANVVEGFGSLADYTSADYLKSNGHYGAIVGRFANRIRGAKITLDGKSYALDPDKDGNLDQGGTMAYFRQVFRATPKDGPEPSLVLTHTDPDGFMGFPGKVEVTITYTLTRTNALRVDMRATTDKKTVINLINHSYFKLSDSPTVDGETLQLFAHHYTPIDFRQHPHRRNPRRNRQRFRFHARRASGPALFHKRPRSQERPGSQFRDRRQAGHLADRCKAQRSGLRPGNGGVDHPAGRSDL